jgi:hypothetical protein
LILCADREDPVQSHKSAPGRLHDGGVLRIEGFSGWVDHFVAEAQRRRALGDPDWTQAAVVDEAVARSVQRFQVGEAGDGANLIAKADAAGDPDYAAAARLFVAEEQNHARMLDLLLRSAGRRPIASHWSDVAFVRLRRAAGLRLELMVLMIAEVIALGYYRALRDGSCDALTSEVAGRILADEQRHVPFHTQRLRDAFRGLPDPLRAVVVVFWWLMFGGAAMVVAADHGAALVALGVRRRTFLREVVALFRRAVAATR